MRDGQMREAFEKDGILVGWYGTMRNSRGDDVEVFIPRRDEDIDEDRAAIQALLKRACPK